MSGRKGVWCFVYVLANSNATVIVYYKQTLNNLKSEGAREEFIRNVPLLFISHFSFLIFLLHLLSSHFHTQFSLGNKLSESISRIVRHFTSDDFYTLFSFLAHTHTHPSPCREGVNVFIVSTLVSALFIHTLVARAFKLFFPLVFQESSDFFCLLQFQILVLLYEFRHSFFLPFEFIFEIF